MKKKILIIGGSHSDIPLIQSAKKLGLHVITSGNDKHGLGHKFADEICLEDFSNKEMMLKLARKLNIDFVCSGSNDFAVITASYIAEKLNLPGYDSYNTTLTMHHKDRFKKFALKHGFLVPPSLAFDNVQDAENSLCKLSYPSIVKPIDLTGGKGISKILNKEDGKKAVEKAFDYSRAKKIVIDEFIEGSLHSFSTILRSKKVVFYFADNEFSYLNKYLVSTSNAPAKNFLSVQEVLMQQAEKLASMLNLVDGILHMQYILDNSNNIHIIEFTRRMPGDLYAMPVDYATQIDYAKWVVMAACGMDIAKLTLKKQKGFFSRHCIMANTNGTIENVVFDNAIQSNIVDKLTWWDKGDVIENFMTYKAGIVFLKYNSQEEMDKKTMQINQLIKIELQ